MNWAYFSIIPNVKCAFRPVDDGTNELVILVNLVGMLVERYANT